MTVTESGRREARPRDSPPHLFRRVHARLHANRVTGAVTKIVVTTIGVLVLCAGIVMMVTPGPGLVGIAVGLGILATEWRWAERWVTAARDKAREAAERARRIDPAVRRRRLLLAGGALVVVAGGGVALLLAFGWPTLAVNAWNWVQDLNGAVPELPGM